jgi:hypothetical protein
VRFWAGLGTDECAMRAGADVRDVCDGVTGGSATSGERVGGVRARQVARDELSRTISTHHRHAPSPRTGHAPSPRTRHAPFPRPIPRHHPHAPSPLTIPTHHPTHIRATRPVKCEIPLDDSESARRERFHALRERAIDRVRSAFGCARCQEDVSRRENRVRGASCALSANQSVEIRRGRGGVRTRDGGECEWRDDDV